MAVGLGTRRTRYFTFQTKYLSSGEYPDLPLPCRFCCPPGGKHDFDGVPPFSFPSFTPSYFSQRPLRQKLPVSTFINFRLLASQTEVDQNHYDFLIPQSITNAPSKAVTPV